LYNPEANKTQIKEAVEKMFEGTKVKSVNTINNDGKKKRRGMVVGKTAKTQKSYRSSYRREQRYRDLRRTLIRRSASSGTSDTSEAEASSVAFHASTAS